MVPEQAEAKVISERDKMRMMLLLAAEQFEHYASHHKETSACTWYSPERRSEARKKADVNEQWANKCRAAAGFTP